MNLSINGAYKSRKLDKAVGRYFAMFESLQQCISTEFRWIHTYNDKVIKHQRHQIHQGGAIWTVNFNFID